MLRYRTSGNIVCRTALLIAILWICEPTGHAQEASSAASELTLAQAIDLALAANPTIMSARLQRPIDAAGVAVAGERLNPELLYEEARETPRQALGLTLPLELGGKRQRRIDVATAAMSVGEASLTKIVADVRREVRRSYVDAEVAIARREIADDVRELALRARAAARARVDAGDAPQSDLTQADLILEADENDRTAARGEETATLMELNALIGRHPAEPVHLSDSLSARPLPDLDTLTRLASTENADLEVLDRQIAEQQAKIDLARALTVPDVSVGATLTYDAQPEFNVGWRATAGITLPVFTRHKAAVTVEEATLALLKRNRDGQVVRTEATIAAALARASAAHDQISRYDASILPLAREAERQAQAAYAGGQIGLAALVQAIQSARDTRQRGLQARIDYEHALLALEQAVGAPLP